MASVDQVGDDELSDFIAAPNISANPEVYELENRALQRDGQLDQALHELAPWDGRTLVDVGCGTGFWLPAYAERARRVIGVEPDRQLLEVARHRVADVPNVEVVHGSAERLPLDDDSADIVHARFAYFFGEGSEAGLAEVLRVLRPGGTFIAVDNSRDDGDFAALLRIATTGNAAIDPDRTRNWWERYGAERHEVIGGWSTESPEQLERILSIEFPPDVVDEFLTDHSGPDLSYHFALFVVRAPT